MRFVARTALTAMAVGILPLFGSQTAIAQSVIEEITVTAQKREESLADVPVALTVLTEDQIEASFSRNIEDLQALVPSVSFRTGNTTRNSALTVRGIGTISFSIGAEPSVSTVVDGVVLGRSGQAFADLYDLERVEVLRGPQGTLFGKNASAGVVNITTRRPTETFEAQLRGTFYQDNEYLTRARVSGPLGGNDDLRGSLTVVQSQFDGYIQNVFNNETVNGYDKRGVRAMLDYDISDRTNVLFIFEDYEADNDCCADLEARPSGRNPASEAAPRGGDLSLGQGIDLDQRLIDHDFETRTLDAFTGASIQINSEFDSGHTFTSITAFRSWDNTEFREGDFTSIAGDSTDTITFGDGSPPFQLHDVGPQEWRQVSQELRIASPVGEALEYQVGFFYWNIDSERNFTREASCQNNADQFDAAIANHLEFTLGLPNAPADVAAFIADNNLTCNASDIVSATGFFDTEFTNWAVFGQGTYSFTDQVRLIFGLRYTDDEVSFNHNRRNNDEFGRRGVGVRPRFADTTGPNANQTDTNLSGTTDETDLSGRIGVQFDLSDSTMIFGSYTQGYKGPAFNVFYNMDDDDIDPLDPETSDSIEIGLKYAADWGIVSLVAYDTEIQDFQANDFDDSDGTTVTGFTNGGDVETSGFELDVLANINENFFVSGGVAVSDATSVNDSQEIPFAPDLKYSIAGQYDIPMDGGRRIQINGSYVYTDEQLSGNIGQTGGVFLLPDYAILNASVGYFTEDDKLGITLIGKNLTDESYATTFSGDGFRYQIPRNADRYFGIDFVLNFN